MYVCMYVCMSVCMYACMHVGMWPPLALGHLPRNEAAGHQIVTRGHSAWPWGRDVAPSLGVSSRVVAGSPSWPSLPWRQDDRLGGTRWIMICNGDASCRRGPLIRRVPARLLTSPPLEGVKRCVTLWCGLHVPHCARLGLDMPLQRRRRLLTWGSPG